MSYSLTFFQNNQLPDGIFNFVFTVDRSLFAAPLENAFEFGAKHKHVAAFARARSILSAGEMLKSGGTIQFNLSSGTFMKDFMITTLEQKCNTELVAHTIELFKLYYPHLNIQYATRTFLTLTELPLKREHLVKYANAGYEVRLYSQKKACMEESGPYTLFQRASRRKTRRRRSTTKKRKNGAKK